jgi:hypothetical protein
MESTIRNAAIAAIVAEWDFGLMARYEVVSDLRWMFSGAGSHIVGTWLPMI